MASIPQIKVLFHYLKHIESFVYIFFVDELAGISKVFPCAVRAQQEIVLKVGFRFPIVDKTNFNSFNDYFKYEIQAILLKYDL